MSHRLKIVACSVFVGTLGCSKSVMLVNASLDGNLFLVKTLLAAGADPNVCRAPEGITPKSPLCAAAITNHVDVAAALIQAGAKVDQECGERPMDFAVANGNVEIVKLLLASGADPVGTEGGAGWTYLMKAAIDAEASVIPVLAKAGCPLEAVRPAAREDPNDREGQTALMIAAGWDPRPTRALIDVGANVNARDAAGATPLIHALRGAARQGPTSPGVWDISIVNMLLDAGADPNARDSAGETPLSLADQCGHNAAVVREILLKAGAK